MIQIRCFQSIGELASLREEINALNRASESPDPFSTLEFYESYVSHDQLHSEANSVELRFLVAFEEGRIVGYLPLKQSSVRVLGLRSTKLSFFAVHDIDLPHLVTRAEYAQQIAEALHAYLFNCDRSWGLLELQQQAKDSLFMRPPFQNAPKGYRVRYWPGWSNCSIPIRWGSIRDYFGELKKKFRGNVSRQMRGLFAAGVLEFIESSDPEATPSLLELYLGVEPHSWKWQAGLSIGKSSPRIEYFQSLLAAEQPMRISVLLLLLDGAPIAGLINGAYAGALYALQVVFDDRLSRLAPGSAILLLGVRQAILGRYRTFNLLSGFDYFKNRWLAQTTETRGVQIYRISSPFFWRRTLGDWMRSMLSLVKRQSPMLSNPDRKAVTPMEGASTDPAAASAIRPTPEQQCRIDELLEKARRGRCQSLSAAELAVAMPFETTNPRAGLESAPAVLSQAG